jgi:hypothetical protein
MTEEQKKRKAERDKKYRLNKKLKAELSAIHPATLVGELPEPSKAALDAIRPIPVLEDYPTTNFDVLMRRMRRESAK